MEKLNDSPKYNELIEYLKNLKSVAVAFSGGVDSTFLLAAAREALGINVVAFTIKTPYIPDWEIDEAKQITDKLSIRHIMINADISKSIANNPENRCYLCKKAIFAKLIDEAEKLDISNVVDGTNYDDTEYHRPGIRALKELGIKSPLLVNKITKSDIRAFSKLMGLKTWDKPAYACLLTRIPYDTEIREEELRRVEQAELFIMKLGFGDVRVRSHDNLARIELDKERLSEIFRNNLHYQITDKLKEMGFKYVTLDIEGYRTGSMDG
jgi:uncharacterized protein